MFMFFRKKQTNKKSERVAEMLIVSTAELLKVHFTILPYTNNIRRSFYSVILVNVR